MGGFLIINPRSGKGGPETAELRAEAERRGIATHVLSEGDDPAALAREGEPPLGVAGGDGSLAAVAEVGLDRDDPVAALEAFAGSERRVDVGRANDRLFLNNVSLGLYARLVRRRERE